MNEKSFVIVRISSFKGFVYVCNAIFKLVLFLVNLITCLGENFLTGTFLREHMHMSKLM